MLDQRGRTLLEIINDPQNGWGVRAELLRNVLGAHSKNLTIADDDQRGSLKIDVLTAIVDGPIDADKADYIIRDSSRCELPYGAQLDIERLLRVLTVAVLPGDAAPVQRVTLGVYDKGLASAHAFGQARYQLLSSVYWHHTARIAKAMLQYATALGLPLEVFGPKTPERDQKELQIRERLLAFVKSLVPPFDVQTAEEQRRDDDPKEVRSLNLAAEPPEQVISILSEDNSREIREEEGPSDMSWYPGISWTDWLMLKWLQNLPNSNMQSRSLIAGIQSRRLYKRIASFVRGGAHSNIIRRLENLSWTERIEVCTKLHQRVYDRLKREWENLNTATTMTRTELDRLCDSRLIILLDIPSPSKKIGYDRPLGVVPELREKSYQQDTRQASEDKNWRDIMTSMIEAIAPVRILCHPSLRNLISAVCAPVETSMARDLIAILGLDGL